MMVAIMANLHSQELLFACTFPSLHWHSVDVGDDETWGATASLDVTGGEGALLVDPSPGNTGGAEDSLPIAPLESLLGIPVLGGGSLGAADEKDGAVLGEEGCKPTFDCGD
eukprot:TRINITY_DN20043_c0_g1_i1.p2 TRINITY_DN20043_c0_g1~~TRINITY_DN20043_c0_g1_i1.p2  ORF type:complete len:111 (+),score=8.95 TRINITY_DN20043_c0_g1_i1:129-461(+)